MGSHNLVSEPVRGSKRTLLKICSSELARKHIPIGDFFQADIPDWTGSPNKEDLVDDTNGLSNSKWLGTKLWPIERVDKQLCEEVIGKGSPHLCE